MINIGVLVSGNGTNLQALIDAKNNGKIKNGNIVVVVSNKEDAYALERAKQNNIDSVIISRKDYLNSKDFNIAIAKLMKRYDVGLIVMAGFLAIVDENLVNEFKNKIINIHPSVIPKHCGKGMYGLKVHENVLKSDDKYTGATVHIVTTEVDGGPIILQKADIIIKDNDTPETLQRRVMEEAEWIILPMAVDLFCDDLIEIIDNKVLIKKEC